MGSLTGTTSATQMSRPQKAIAVLLSAVMAAGLSPFAQAPVLAYAGEVQAVEAEAADEVAAEFSAPVDEDATLEAAEIAEPEAATEDSAALAPSSEETPLVDDEIAVEEAPAAEVSETAEGVALEAPEMVAVEDPAESDDAEDADNSDDPAESDDPEGNADGESDESDDDEEDSATEDDPEGVGSSCVVIFDDGEGEDHHDVEKGKSLNEAGVLPEYDPWREGYVFVGWTLDGEAYDLDAPVTKDITLVASWEKALVEAEGDYFLSVQDALDDQDVSTIVLLADVTENLVVPAGREATIDLNGHNITNATGNHTVTVEGALYVNDNSDEASGKIVSTSNCGICVAGGLLSFESGSVEAQEMALLLIDGAEAYIGGGTFTAKDNAVIGTNGSAGRGGNNLEIDGGAFYGSIQATGFVACGIYVANNDTVDVNAGDFVISGGAGIVARAGQVSLGDVSITTTGTATGKVGDSRVVVPCSALVFDLDAAYPGYLEGESSIGVSGGTYVSEADSVTVVGSGEQVIFIDEEYPAFSDDSGKVTLITDEQNTLGFVKGEDGLYHLTEIVKSNFAIDSVAAATYAGGKAVTPAVTVVDREDGTVVSPEHYTVSYSNNVNAGTATVIVKLAEEIDGYTVDPEARTLTKRFTIAPANVTPKIAPIADQTYAGRAVTPAVKVTVDGRTLPASSYTVRYTNNNAAGTARVNVTLKGNYRGSAAAAFTITAPVTAQTGADAVVDDEPAPSKDAAPAKVEKTADAQWERLDGPIALDTMASIVDAGGYPAGTTVVLVTVDGYWDALTATALAGLEGGTVLMTDGRSLSPQTAAELKKLKPSKLLVAGGTAAVSDEVVRAAEAAAGLTTSTRYWGAMATDTANDIFLKNRAKFGTSAFLATSKSYHDALAAAPISYAKGMPIFLTDAEGNLTDATLKAMVDGGIKEVYIVGGTAAIPAATAGLLESKGIKVVDRAAGATAIETSALVAEYGVSVKGMIANKVGVATAGGYWDALSGASLCGKNNTVLILVNDEKSASINSFVKKHGADIATGYVFGGTAAVTDQVKSACEAVTKLAK